MSNFKITFSSVDKRINVPIYIKGDGDSLGLFQNDMSINAIEKIMLANLAEVAANSYKDKKQIFIALDLAGRIENLPEGKNEIIIDTMDKTILEKGIEETAGKRPSPWMKCRDLWAQLNEMPEIKVKEE